MAMTAEVKDELSRLVVNSVSARRAEVASLLRFAGGLHIVSGTHLQDNVSLSTRFQFGDHIGVGVRRGHYDLGLRLQHLSNAGLRNPNPGINFVQLRVAYELH